MIMLTTITTLLISGIAFVIIDKNTAEKNVINRLTILSKVIADRSTAAIAFNDEDSANKTLTALKQDKSVLAGCIYTIPHKLFAYFNEPDNLQCPENRFNDGALIESNHLYISQSIVINERPIGTILIISTLTELNKRLQWFLIIVSIVILFTSIAAFYLSNTLQKIITSPLLKLIEVTDFISSNKDYSQKLPQGGQDEIGVLYRSFSKMIEKIRSREEARDTAEDTLRSNENNLEITLNSIGDAVIATDAEGSVTRMNFIAEQLTGWPLSDAKGKNLKHIFPIFDVDTRQPITNPVDKVISTGEIVYLNNHTTLISKDGNEHQISDSAAPIRDKNGNIKGMVLVFNDVTEQYNLREIANKSKQGLQAIMDHSPAVIYVKDYECRYTFVNKQFENIFNIQREVIIGKKDNDIFPIEISSQLSINDNEVLLTGNSLESEESIIIDNDSHSYVTVKFPLLNTKGKVYSLCGISTDITDRQQQEIKLHRVQKMDALGKLTGGIAHDYNNMLSVVLGYSDLLASKLKGQPSLLKYVNEISHASNRGAKLTKKLLDFSKQKTTQTEIINLNKLLKEEQNLLEKTLTARIKLTFDLDQELWPIKVDIGDLEDSIINMSINAMHAINGNGTLNIKTSNLKIEGELSHKLNTSSGDYVSISISDTGCGIDEVAKSKIFDPFYSTKGEMGTGLGLSQVYGFIERSGGFINVNSRVGEGSEFLLYFPRSNEILLSPTKQSRQSGINGEESILLVDDEPSLLALSKEILSSHGYHVFTADNGINALGILATEKIDLLLSDVIMPEMDGYELAAETQKKYPSVKILLASGYAGSYHEDKVNDALKKQLLHKPYKSDELLGRIRELLDE